MAKSKKSVLARIIGLVGLLISIAAMVCMLAPGLGLFGEKAQTFRPLYGIIFGGGEAVTSTGIGELKGQIEGGMSYMALASFIACALGILGSLVSVIMAKKGGLLVSGLLIIIGAGVMFACKEVGGTPLTVAGKDALEYLTYAKDLEYGYGLYLYSIGGMVGGITTIIAAAFVRK